MKLRTDQNDILSPQMVQFMEEINYKAMLSYICYPWKNTVNLATFISLLSSSNAAETREEADNFIAKLSEKLETYKEKFSQPINAISYAESDEYMEIVLLLAMTPHVEPDYIENLKTAYEKYIDHMKKFESDRYFQNLLNKLKFCNLMGAVYSLYPEKYNNRFARENLVQSDLLYDELLKRKIRGDKTKPSDIQKMRYFRNKFSFHLSINDKENTFKYGMEYLQLSCLKKFDNCIEYGLNVDQFLASTACAIHVACASIQMKALPQANYALSIAKKIVNTFTPQNTNDFGMYDTNDYYRMVEVVNLTHFHLYQNCMLQFHDKLNGRNVENDDGIMEIQNFPVPETNLFSFDDKYDIVKLWHNVITILGLMGGSSTSHHVWHKVIFHNLAQRGHNLTVLSPDVDKEVTPGLHYIMAEKVYPTIAERVSKSNEFGMDSITATISFYGFGNASCTGFYISEGFQVLLNYPEDFKFDLILVDYIFEPCLLGFVHKFKYPPTITVNPFSIPTYIYDFIGGYTQPSYVPHVNVEYDVEMNFLQRVHNFLVYIWADWYRKNRFIPQQEATMKIAFKDPTIPKAAVLQKSIVLALTNTHYSIEKMEPLPPNIIPVGGLQIEKPKPLVKDVEAFIERSTKGTILFSLGTILKSEFLDNFRKQSFIDAFADFPDYHFIWKAKDIDLHLPSNVKTFSWLNQSDILAHPKVVAFISHCGLLGTQEAAWYGKPVIGIPFYSDQYRNLRNGIRAGTSIKLDYFDISKSTVKAALTEIIGNSKYTENARRRSKLFRDQPEAPIDRAIFWIEWVLRHNGDYAAIQLPINDLGIIVSNSYDVIAFLFLLLWGLFMSLLVLVRKILRKKPERRKQD